MLEHASKAGVRRCRIHVLLDGRDVEETSALTYVEQLEEALVAINRDDTRDFAVASGGGRMTTTMDRYEADWPMVERGWRAHVHGDGRGFASMRQAVETFRAEVPGITDRPPIRGSSRWSTGRQDRRRGCSTDTQLPRRSNDRNKPRFRDAEFDAFDRGQRPDVFCWDDAIRWRCSDPEQLFSRTPADRCTMSELLCAGIFDGSHAAKLKSLDTSPTFE